jgi:hypothetical protein
MKIKKTNVFRLELEKDNCPCHIAREFSDGRYTTPLIDPVFTPCEKHAAVAEVAEFAQEMMIEALATEALNSGKQFTTLQHRQVEVGDSAGVTASGETVQALGVTNLPNRRRDPLAVTHMSVDRPASRSASLGNLKTASAAEDGIEISAEIGEEAAEDPKLSAYMEDALGGLEFLDQDDAKLQGVPQKVLENGE